MTIARKQSFERVATEYDGVRPGYPRDVYEHIIDYGCLTREARVLEVASVLERRRYDDVRSLDDEAGPFYCLAFARRPFTG